MLYRHTARFAQLNALPFPRPSPIFSGPSTSSSLISKQPLSRSILSRRSFHQTSRRQLTFTTAVDTACTHAHDALTSLHSVLPWYLALPVAAVLVRTVFVLPLDLWSRKHRNNATLVRPLLSAWTPILQAQTRRENGHLGAARTHKLYLQAMRKKRKELYSKFGVRTWPGFAPIFLQLPVFLVVIETIRRMCGTREGLLGLLAKSFTSSEDIKMFMRAAGVKSAYEPAYVEGAADAVDIVSGTNADLLASAEFVSGTAEAGAGSGVVAEGVANAAADATVDAVAGASSAATDAAATLQASFLEPSLATEGALWFPDLLMADSNIMLPMMLSAMIFANVEVNRRQLAWEGIETTKGSRGYTRFMQLVALAVGPATLAAPAALMVYWITSSASALVLHLVVARSLRRPLGITAGKLKKEQIMTLD